MEEVKEIIISRIKDLHQINATAGKESLGDRKPKLSMAIAQRNGETDRCHRESQILAAQVKFGEVSDKMVRELGAAIGQILQSYDKQEREFPTNSYEIFSQLKLFFINNGFREKIAHLNTLAAKKMDMGTCGIILAWLSEWSRRKYCQMLQKGITMQRSVLSTSEVVQPSSDKKIRRCYDIPTKDKILTEQSQKQSSKQLILISRATVYGFIVPQMQLYYKMYSFLDTDLQYLKTVKKKGKKQKLLEVPNLLKTAQVLIETKQNKGISKNIKDYCREYEQYKQKIQEIKINRKRVHSNVQPKLIQQNESIISNKKLVRECKDDVFERLNLPKSCKIKNNQGTPQKMMEELRIHENIRKLKQLQRSSGLKLPQVSRSFQKQSSIWSQKSIIKFPTQSQYERGDGDDTGYPEESSGLHLTHRSSIKGIVIRNFLSNRQALAKKAPKVCTLPQQKNHLVLIGNKSLSTTQSQNNHHQSHQVSEQKHICGSVDLRSLRQRAKALIKNFNMVKNYQ